MNIQTKMRNEMTAIVGKTETRIGNRVYTYGIVKDNGRLRKVYVGSRINKGVSVWEVEQTLDWLNW